MNRFGDGLVTLLMLALGLGCLGQAFHGVMDGVAGGAGGASFPLATKPVKFVLIELFWSGLGLIFLLGAWRGVSRREVDVDDENGDEGEEVTRPVRFAAAPLSAPTGAAQVARASTAARTSSLDMALPLPSAANIASTNGDPAGLASKAAAPKSLELFTSRSYAVLVFIVFTLFVVGSAYTAMALASVFGQALMGILMVPIVLAYVITMAQCLRNFFWTGPVLVLDLFGITNHRKGGHLIPWTEVDAVRLAANNAATYLVLRFRDAGDVYLHFGQARWLRAIAGRLFYKGFEGRVKLTSLVFKRSMVLQSAQAFLRYSRR